MMFNANGNQKKSRSDHMCIKQNKFYVKNCHKRRILDHTKINLKLITNFNVRHETVKLLEGTYREIFITLSLAMISWI